MGNMKNTC